MLSTQEIQAVYQRHAKRYDLSVRFYRLMGLCLEAYRSRSIELLRLERGDTVVDLGCGTGLNFPRLVQQVGRGGRLIGVDVSSEMLACARERTERAGWQNVELTEADLSAYELPSDVRGILSTGVCGYVTEFDRVIRKTASGIASGGRLVILDGKSPERWPAWLFKSFVRLSRRFGLTPGYFDNQTWRSVERAFKETELEEMYGGLFYIVSGTAP